MINQRSTSYSVERTLSLVPESVDFNSEPVYKIKKHFWWFSVVASINHALNYVVTSYATSLLGLSILFFIFVNFT